jgi:hypothetical protein
MIVDRATVSFEPAPSCRRGASAALINDMSRSIHGCSQDTGSVLFAILA